MKPDSDKLIASLTAYILASAPDGDELAWPALASLFPLTYPDLFDADELEVTVVRLNPEALDLVIRPWGKGEPLAEELAYTVIAPRPLDGGEVLEFPSVD